MRAQHRRVVVENGVIITVPSRRVSPCGYRNSRGSVDLQHLARGLAGRVPDGEYEIRQRRRYTDHLGSG